MDRGHRLSVYLPVLFSLVLYATIGYFIERNDSTYLLGAYIFLFASYLWLYNKSKPCSTSFFLFAALAFRLVFLFSFPSLSDDIFRFYWDGTLLENGINPFEMLPSELIDQGLLSTQLGPDIYGELNSPDYFTIYPPFAQFIFWVSASLSENVLGSAVIIRLLILFAELGTFYFLVKLLKHYNMASNKVLLYALNPLVIIELTGNLHFEAFMIFFLMAGIYYLIKNRLMTSAFFWSLAIASKLIPLIFLPLFIRKVKTTNLLKWYAAIGFFTLLLFAPLMSHELINGMSKSINLYFQKFEFNAGIYFLIREIGYAVKGYNMIQTVGPWLALFTIISILLLTYFSKKINLIKTFAISLTIYLLLTTTVHPWYLTTLLAMSVLVSYRFSILWSFLIFFTYIGYSQSGFQENYWVVGIEYVSVIVYMIYELFIKTKQQATPHMV